MTKEPKISVLMGIYNCESTVGEAIASIFQQTYPHWELILCDDGSTDGTYETAKRYAAQRPDQCVLLRNDKNRKLAYTLNRCLHAASGELIARMDGDDISHPDRFEKQVDYLRSHPDIQLVGTGMQAFDESGPVRRLQRRRCPDQGDIRSGVPFFHATILAQRTVFDTLKGYTAAERTDGVEDMEFWFRFYAQGFRGENMAEILYDVRDDLRTARRRTFSRRVRAVQTLAFGYRLLGIPRYRLVFPGLALLAKGLVPPRMAQWIRKRSPKAFELKTGQ